MSVLMGRIVIVLSASARFMSTMKVERPTVLRSPWSLGFVRASSVDLLELPARGGERGPRAAVRPGDEGGDPAVGGQRRADLLGVAVRLERPPVFAGEARAEGAYRGPDLVQLAGGREVQLR